MRRDALMVEGLLEVGLSGVGHFTRERALTVALPADGVLAPVLLAVDVH